MRRFYCFSFFYNFCSGPHLLAVGAATAVALGVVAKGVLVIWDIFFCFFLFLFWWVESLKDSDINDKKEKEKKKKLPHLLHIYDLCFLVFPFYYEGKVNLVISKLSLILFSSWVLIHIFITKEKTNSPSSSHLCELLVYLWRLFDQFGLILWSIWCHFLLMPFVYYY